MHRHTISKDKEKKEGQRHHEESRRIQILKIVNNIINCVVYGIVISIVKNVHNLFAILFQRNLGL